METVETRKGNGMLLEIFYDDAAESPREETNLGIMACSHPDYELGDVQIRSQEEYDSRIKGAVAALPLYLYDHSGISMSTCDSPFDSQMWDTSRVGTIYTTTERIAEFYDKAPDSRQIAERLKDEVRAYDRYLQGHVYGYRLCKTHTCSLGEKHQECIDSGGRYHDIDDILSECDAKGWEVIS